MRPLKSISTMKIFTYMMNNMKIKFLLPFFLIFTISVLGQQGDKERWEQIKAAKSSHIAAALNLSSIESQKFWTLYLAHEDKQYEIRNKIKTLVAKISEKNIDNMKIGDAQMNLVQLQDAEEELYNIRKKLIIDLKAIIGPKKILKLISAEDSFNAFLLKKYKS